MVVLLRKWRHHHHCIEAPSFGVSVIMHDATCKGAINYLNLAREIIEKNGLTKDTATTAAATV